jgi:mannonate dehydratase
MKRRTFSKTMLTSLGFLTLGESGLMANTGKDVLPGNKWSAEGRRLGISHQRPGELHEKHLNYLRQMGVEYLEIRIPGEEASLDTLKTIKTKVEDAGLKVFEIMLSDKYNCKDIALGNERRAAEMKFFHNFLRDLGKAGIDTTTYAWHTGGAYKTGTTMIRGCEARLFELEEAKKLPNLYDRTYSDEEMWDNYAYFIKHTLPVAEDAGVRLQLHPNDPPVTHQGVARIFRSMDAFRQAMEIADHSPMSGVLFCTGTCGEMTGPDGKGENIIQGIHDLGSQGHIYQVHFRNVSGPMPDFYETMPDNGYMNMYKIMKALSEVNFNGIVVPDHVPRIVDSEACELAGEAYIFGYIKALIQAADTELGPVQV